MKIAVIAPSGPVDLEALERGEERLRERIPGLEFVHAPGLDRNLGYLAGEDDERRDGVLWAFRESGADAVWFARGGFGATRLVGRIPWADLASGPRPLPLLGYSDATAFLAAYDAAGGPAVHAPMIAADLAYSATERSWESLVRLFRDESDLFLFDGDFMEPPADGLVLEGPILAANAAVLAALAGTPHFPSGRGRIICLEEVHEEPYRVDRLLVQLRDAGLFRDCRGVVFGSMTGCVPEDPTKSWPVEEVLARFAEESPVPVVSGFPFGHGGTNTVLPWGTSLRIEKTSDGLRARVERGGLRASRP